MPLGLALTVLAIRSRRPVFVAGSALCLALSLSAGHTDPPLVGLAAIVVLYVAASRWPLAPGDQPLGLAPAGAALVVTLALFVGFAAPQLLVMHEYAKEAVRFVGANHPIPGTANLSRGLLALNPHLQLHEMGNFGFFRAPAPGDTPAYVGTVGLVLGGAGILSRRRGIGPWGVMAIIGVVLAFGTATPVLPFLVRVIPAISQFREPSRYLMLTALAAPVLVAAALQRVQDAPREGRTQRLAPATAGAACLAVVVAIILVVHGAGPVPVDDFVVGLILAAVAATILLLAHRFRALRRWGAALLVVLLSVELVSAFRASVPAVKGSSGSVVEATWDNPDLESVTTYLARATSGTKELGQRVATISPSVPRNWGSVTSLLMTTSYSATLMSRFFLLLQDGGLVPPSVGARLMATQYVIADASQPSLGLPVVDRSGSLLVYRATAEAPAAWLVGTTCPVASPSAAVRHVLEAAPTLSSVAYVEELSGGRPASAACEADNASRAGSAEIRSWSESGSLSSG